MHSYYIGCDVQPIQTSNGNWVRCPFSDATVYTEQAVQDLYGSQMALMDNDDYQILGQHAAFMFVVAFGVFLIRRILGN